MKGLLDNSPSNFNMNSEDQDLERIEGCALGFGSGSTLRFDL